MSDLIRRRDAIDALHDEIVRRRISEDTNDDGALDEFDTEAILRQLPTAQPEIIRCKDCVLTDGHEPIADGRYWCMLHGAYMYYCSAAERRTDE